MSTHIYTWRPTKYKTFEAVESKETGKTETEEVEKESPFEGTIDIKIPKYSERLQYSKECNISVNDGEISHANHFDAATKLLEIAKKHIGQIKLKRIDDGFEFTSADQMEYDREASEVLSQIGAKILEGFKLGKN